MGKFWVIFKAVILFLSTNREIIEKHIKFIKDEIAELKAKKEAENAADKESETTEK